MPCNPELQYHLAVGRIKRIRHQLGEHHPHHAYISSSSTQGFRHTNTGVLLSHLAIAAASKASGMSSANITRTMHRFTQSCIVRQPKIFPPCRDWPRQERLA